MFLLLLFLFSWIIAISFDYIVKAKQTSAIVSSRACPRCKSNCLETEKTSYNKKMKLIICENCRLSFSSRGVDNRESF